MTDTAAEQLTLEAILTDVCAQRHCPICFILADRTSTLLRQLQYAAVYDTEGKARVSAAGGYCNFHFWRLEKLASPATNALLLESLLEQRKAALLSCQDDPQRLINCFTTALRCPVCCACCEWEEELLSLFATKAPENGFWAAYQHCRGLCLPHLVQILERLPDREARSALITAACRQLDGLLHDLRLQFVKWQTEDRSARDEREATDRAIEKLVGGNRSRFR